MIRKYFKYLLLLLFTLFIGLGSMAYAIGTVTPANCELNTAIANQTLYTVDNSIPRINIYALDSENGFVDTGTHVSLPAGSKCYGMTLNAAGNKLYVSVANAMSSKVQVYDLDANGIPTGTPTDMDMTGTIWLPVSAPAGMALNESLNRLYVADLSGRLRVFNTFTNAWVKDVFFTTQTPHYDVAVARDKIYVSNKANPGKIMIYSFSGDTITPDGEYTGLTYPTYLWANDYRLYAAVNGTDNVAVKAYNTEIGGYIGDVTVDVSGSYGWNSFAVSADGSLMVIKNAQDANENSSKLYRINTNQINNGNGTVAAEEIVLDPPVNIIKSDSLAISNSKVWAGINYSANGNFQTVDITPPVTENHPPGMPTALEQYKSLDGTNPDLTQPIAEGDPTDQDHVIVRFTISDPDAGDVLTPFVEIQEHPYEGLFFEDPITFESTQQYSSGDVVTMRIPLTDALANGSYEWRANARDSSGEVAAVYAYFGTGVNNIDFEITGGDFQITETIPADNATGVNVATPITIIFNRAVERSSFHIDITPSVTFGTPVWSAGDTQVSLPHPDFLTDTQYTFDVTAESTLAEPLTGQTQFTFRTSTDPNPAPYIVETTPVDGTTDVTLNQEIKITFSQAMNQSMTYTINPNPGGTWTVNWNASNTQATLVHDTQFAANTQYQFEVTGATGANGLALIPGLVPNPFTFETGTDVGDPIVNIEVTRDGDNPGDGITITWDTIPPGIGVDVYKLTCNTDANGNYLSYFTTDPAQWALEQSNITSGTYTIQNQVGTGTAEYYKLIPTGNTLQNTDLETNVAGKFDIAVGPEVERFFISSPLALSDTTLENVIGGQVEENDWIGIFNDVEEITAGSMYMAGAWQDFPVVPPVPRITDFELGHGYGYFTSTSRFITIVGMVPETNFTMTLLGGPTANPNWIGQPFPAPVDIADAGLNDTNYSTDIAQATALFRLMGNAEAEEYPGGLAFHKEELLWTDATFQDPSPLILTPGKGYFLRDFVKTSPQWQMQKPY